MTTILVRVCGRPVKNVMSHCKYLEITIIKRLRASRQWRMPLFNTVNRLGERFKMEGTEPFE